jgi:hypothetical protein
MLRVHIGGFARRDPEKLRVEEIESIDKSAASGNRFAGYPRLGIIEPFKIPAVWWNFTDCLTALNEEFPEGFSVVYTAGKPATDSNDGNTFFMHTIKLAELKRNRAFPDVRGLLAEARPFQGEEFLTKRRLGNKSENDRGRTICVASLAFWTS